MGNIVKIVLALNILAAGAGIFFGITKKGAIGELQTSVQTAKQNADKAQGDLNKLKTDFKTKNTDFDNLKKQLNGLTGSAAQAQAQIAAAQAAQTKAEGDLAKKSQDYKTLNDSLPTLRAQAQAAAQLQAQLTDFENLGLSAAEITQRLNRLKQLEDAAKPPPVKKQPKPKVTFG